MKKILFLAAACIICTWGCTDTKLQEKQLFDQVMVVHDELMKYEEVITLHKSRLDSIAIKNTNKSVADSARLLSQKLAAADEGMTNWMHQFEPDYSDKSHTEAMEYLNAQKAEIIKLDSATKAASREAATFINRHK